MFDFTFCIYELLVRMSWMKLDPFTEKGSQLRMKRINKWTAGNKKAGFRYPVGRGIDGNSD